ncbi:CGNR zinc finger domain-containing protein [Actinoplanes bogorensis]|uniref:CGNR zinc finger domain-containing protein n=1 Tax=Paractinoplanes bogorensis TaxID=1610840 RepID=A0ABS5Z2K1_9ACTN|nr:CGNR zinc finger domain-containing protein [Actinoplanes bogorensis]MBU2669925.1 CGNR zinc finger domain-containing protein [Actinoplanes bogorensis]
MTDPRPLTGEPLPLDLVNTRWSDDDGAYDLFDLPGGLGIWLSSAGLAGSVPESPETLDALRQTRAALFGLMQPEPATHEMLNETLRHGRIVRLLTEDGPQAITETDTPAWRASWLAAEHYLRLLEENPSRIRKCANPVCPLRFYDVSKSGARRWCSMASCGNRSKSRTHYRRHSR